jgi:hypothetical protein
MFHPSPHTVAVLIEFLHILFLPYRSLIRPVECVLELLYLLPLLAYVIIFAMY